MSVIVQYFDHSLASPFFGIRMKTDLFQCCGHCWVFHMCWHIECRMFTASFFRIWNSSTGIPSPPLALFVVMLSKAHLKHLPTIIPVKGKLGLFYQVQETQTVPNRINPRRNIPRHILIKLTKIKHKEQILKAAREKQQITHKGIPIRITADLSIETLQARREWQDILKMMKENNL